MTGDNGIKEKLWTCVASCEVCGKELKRAVYVPERHKNRVIISAPLVAICKTVSHNAYPDCNTGVKLEWIEEGV